MSNSVTHKNKKKEQINLAVLKVPYWVLTMILFLLIPGAAFGALLFTSPTVSRDGTTMGVVTLFYMFAVIAFGWIPAVIAAIVCIVNLVQVHTFPSTVRQAVLYLCGWPLINVLVAVILMVMMFAMISAQLWLLWVILAMIYTGILFTPYILVKHKKLI